MKYVLALLIMFMFPVTVQADEYGPFLCTTGCQLIGSPYPDGDTQTFIENVVNHYDDGQYEMGDTIVICNGSQCATYSRAMFGFVFVKKEADNGGPYLNASAPTGGGGSVRFIGQGGSLTYGIVGLRPIYRTGEVCAEGGGCTRTTVFAGYEPIYGYIYNQFEP
jgi:hypothetical protein